jgi:hypothetical protein
MQSDLYINNLLIIVVSFYITYYKKKYKYHCLDFSTFKRKFSNYRLSVLFLLSLKDGLENLKT